MSLLAITLTFLGAAREISHSTSASRDTAVPGFLGAPHGVLTGGIEAAVFSLASDDYTLRTGIFAMLELEGQGDATTKIPLFGTTDIHFWRGLIGFQTALSFDGWARRALGDGGGFEVTLSGRHESEHQTASNTGGESPDYSDTRPVGNFLMLDAAVRLRRGPVDVVARVQNKVFLPNAAYRDGPGADLHVRWRASPRFHPFVSAFAEYEWGANGYPDAYLVRALVGGIVPSAAGEIEVFVSGDVGNRKGLPAFTREATIGYGVRLAFW